MIPEDKAELQSAQFVQGVWGKIYRMETWMEELIELMTPFAQHWLEALLWLMPYGVIFAVVDYFGRAEPGQGIFRSGFVTDLLHSLINPVLAAPVLALVFAGIQGVGGGLNERNGAVLSAFPFWLQVLAAILAGDIIGYWRHRLLHMKYGWPFHAVHHSSEEMDWLSNDRVDVGENLVTAAFAAGGLFCLGFSPEAAVAQVFARRSYGLFLHCNITWSYGVLDRIFVSPRNHRWHHSADPRAIDRNFATFFSFLDVLFGTYFMPRVEFPHQLGLIREKMPAGYVRQVTYPYLALWRVLRERWASLGNPPIQSNLGDLPHQDPAGKSA